MKFAQNPFYQAGSQSGTPTKPFADVTAALRFYTDAKLMSVVVLAQTLGTDAAAVIAACTAAGVVMVDQ